MNASRYRAFLAAALTVLSGSVCAVPVTFEFLLPDWDYTTDSYFGSSAVLVVTLDNGSASTINQTYLNSQVLSAIVSTVGGTYARTWSGAPNLNIVGQPAYLVSASSLSYFSTDAAGVPTFDLLAEFPTNASIYLIDERPSGGPSFQMQWARPDPNLPPINSGWLIPFGVAEYSPEENVMHSAHISPLEVNGDVLGFSVQGRDCTFPGGGNTGGCFPGPGPFPAPEPGTLTLLGLGLAGLAFTRRRKQ